MKRLKWYVMAMILLTGICNPVFGQQADTNSVNPKRLNTVLIGTSAGYGITMAGLYQLWYADGFSSFRFFNDNDLWAQMDKAGHATTSYYVGWAGMETLRWTGMPRRKAMWYGGGFGLLFLSSVEVLDGFSEDWGFSGGDMIANASGTALLIGQDYLWQEQRLTLKFSYHPTDFAQYRPNTLGSSWNERVLKDYNGQTYWLSGNLASFAGSDSKLPKWLNVAVGYGGTNLVFGSPDSNEPITLEGETVGRSFEHRRQVYFSLDVALNRIPSRKPWVRSMLGAMGFIKIPFPTLEWREGKGLFLHYLYF